MSLDLLLVHPGGAALIYQSLHDDNLTAVETPLWCRLIAGYCRDRGWSVEILDCEAMLLTPEKAAAYVEKRAPRLTAVVAYGHQPSASTQSMAWVTAFCRATQGGQIAIVGGHASALPDQTLCETDATYVIQGEGPVQIDRILAGDSPAGVVGMAPLTPIASLHGAAWDLLHMDLYRAHNWQCFDGSPRTPYASIYTSLGCPFGCSFCCINAPFGKRMYRMREPSDVVAEIAYLYAAYGVRTFKITDEMFVLNPKHYKAICEGLAGMFFADELNIWAYARIDTVKPDTLSLMRKAGIRWLALGIESGSEHVRDGAEKHLNERDIYEIVQAIREAGINVIANYIFGLPDDDWGSMQDTLALAKRLNTEFANFYSAMAYPGSRLYAEASPDDLPRAWSGYSQHSRDCTPLPTKFLSAADVLRFRDFAFHSYFEDTRYLDMLDRKFGMGAVRQVKAMTSRRLERDLVAA